GFYLSARNNEHSLVRQFGGHLIVVARELNYCWDRFVYVKEMMHVFDDPTQALDSGDRLERLLEEIWSGNPDQSPEVKSEINCFFMALGALCPEKYRLEFAEAREKGQIDDYTIALRLRIPQLYVSRLFRPDYPVILQTLTA
ncbi:MAG: hypothetical protein ACKVSF_04440, partial [Alphaproteobacteria bacterium]